MSEINIKLRALPAVYVRRVTGLSSRQLNDWDQRGALPHARVGDAGWRRFSMLDIFSLQVACEIRDRFGTPVERTKWVQDHLLANGAKHLSAAVEMVPRLGANVWLMTDLESMCVIESEPEAGALAAAFHSGDERTGYLAINLKPLIERLLEPQEDLETVEVRLTGLVDPSEFERLLKEHGPNADVLSIDEEAAQVP